MVKREHRSGKERRTGIDRRKYGNPKYKGVERRSTHERRSGTDRRKHS